MRKERNSISSKDFRRTSRNSAAWQSTRRVNPGHIANGQLRISGRVWTSGAPATPDGEFRLLALKKSRNILAALKTASVLGLLILSVGSVAANQRNSPVRLEQGPTGMNATAAVISRVAITQAAQRTAVRVEGEGRLDVHAVQMQNPDRLVLDFADARLAVQKMVIPGESAPVRGVRLGQYRPNVARVVVDLTGVTPYQLAREATAVVIYFDAQSAKPAAVANMAVAASPVLAQTQVSTGMNATAAVISRVAITQAAQRTAVRVEGEGRLDVHAAQMQNPDRLVLDFADARLAVQKMVIPGESAPVRGGRLGQYRPNVARVVVDLTGVTPYQLAREATAVVIYFDAQSAKPAAVANMAVAASPVLAQTQVSTGMNATAAVISRVAITQAAQRTAAVFGVSGVVLDPSNAAIAGAQVTLHGGSLENEPTTATDLAGHFEFAGVTPGSYEVEVQREGFKILKSHVKVELNPSAPLRIVLPLAELHEEVTTTDSQGQLSRDATENADIIRLDRQALDSIPILDNDVVRAVSEMLGPGSGGGVLIVDGVVASEVGVLASAIQEVRINQNPYSAEYSAPGRNRIEIITKNGSSDYHGSLDASFRDYQLDARNAFADARPPERLSLFDGYFSGPLGKSKETTFQVSASQKQDDRQSIVYAQVPSGTLSQNFPNPQRSTYFLAGINRQISKGNNLAVRYSFFNWSDKGNSVGGVNLPEVASDESSNRHYVYVSDRAAITPNLLNEFSVRATTP